MSRGEFKRKHEAILGIDPGLATTGWGMVGSVDSEKYTVHSFGVIKTPSDRSDVKRLVMIYEEMLELINRFKPDRVAVEMLFFGKNAKTAMMVGQARGVILLACYKAGVAIEEFTPLQVKIALTGYGRADKQQMQKMVKQQLGLEELPKPDDAADALAVALTAAVSNEFSQ